MYYIVTTTSDNNSIPKNIASKILEMNLKTTISVDGNVNSVNITDMISAGADLLVLGSSGLFLKNQSIAESILKIKKAIDLAKT